MLPLPELLEELASFAVMPAYEFFQVDIQRASRVLGGVLVLQGPTKSIHQHRVAAVTQAAFVPLPGFAIAFGALSLR